MITMERKEIKKLQEQIDIDDQKQPQSAEKRLKLKESFEEVIKKMSKPKKKKWKIR